MYENLSSGMKALCFAGAFLYLLVVLDGFSVVPLRGSGSLSVASRSNAASGRAGPLHSDMRDKELDGQAAEGDDDEGEGEWDEVTPLNIADLGIDADEESGADGAAEEPVQEPEASQGDDAPEATVAEEVAEERLEDAQEEEEQESVEDSVAAALAMAEEALAGGRWTALAPPCFVLLLLMLQSLFVLALTL